MTNARPLLLVLTVTAIVAACGDNPLGTDSTNGYGSPAPATTGTVSGKPSGTGTTSPSGPGGTADGGTTTTDDGDGDGGGLPANPQAQALFEAMLPTLTATCGGACHVDGKGGAPPWLGPPDAYTSARTYPGIVVADVAASIVLTKGQHEGPNLIDPLRTQVVTWLTAEASSVQAVSLPTTKPITVAAGANSIDLSQALPALAGGKMTFNATATGDVMEFDDIQIVAPASMGAHVVFPIFAVLPPGGQEEDDQSFSNADVTVPAGQTVTLPPGELLLTGWVQGSQLEIQFTKLETVTPTDGGTTTAGGCKSLSTFTADAVPAIKANTCLTCHDTGGSGNASLDLSGLAATPENDAVACAQALNRINPTTPAQSDIILAPTGQVANHPFKNATTAYVQAMEQWIPNEK